MLQCTSLSIILWSVDSFILLVCFWWTFGFVSSGIKSSLTNLSARQKNDPHILIPSICGHVT